MIEACGAGDGMRGGCIEGYCSAAACDSSGQANHGVDISVSTIEMDTPPVNFDNPRSIDFDGAADYINVPHDASLANFTELTISLWVNPDGAVDSSWSHVVSKTRGSSADYGIMWVGNLSGGCAIGNFSFRIWTTTARNVCSETIVSENTGWHHIAGTWDGNTMTVYYNGVAENTLGESGTISNTGNPLSIGNNPNGANRLFPGNVDELRIYNRALSTAEIKRLAQGNQPSTGAGTVTLEDDLTVNSSLVLVSGTLDVNASEDNDIFVGGSWWNYGGDFVARSGSVTFNSTSTGNIIQSNGILESFNIVNIDGASGGWTLNDNITASGTIHLDDGTLTRTGDVTGITITGSLEVDGGTVSGTTELLIDGNLSLLSGTFTAPDNVLVISGNFLRVKVPSSR